MKVTTKHCSVEFIQGSVSTNGDRITTLVLEYPRAIHAQLLTHRVFSKNSSSSRAVPAKRAIAQVIENPAQYLWTQNQSGMQGPVITDPVKLEEIQKLYNLALSAQARVVETLTDPNGLNVHKQNACRLLEPFQNIRICLTSTEWDNWDWLRIDPDAQGEIVDLANAIKQVRDDAQSEGMYMVLYDGEWHVPFVRRERVAKNRLCYYTDDNQIDLEDAIKISMSCAAQTSYRVLNQSLEKANDIMGKLFNGSKVHASPSEHQATPIGDVSPILEISNWPNGVTHMDTNAELWSGNFRGFIQNRQLLPNHDAAKGITNDSSN